MNSVLRLQAWNASVVSAGARRITRRVVLAGATAALVGSMPVAAAEPRDLAASPFEFRAGVELGVDLLSSGFSENSADAFAVATPLLSIAKLERWWLEVGPRFRFRLIDGVPLQRAFDVLGVVRREDFDELSDWGHILRALHVSDEAHVISLTAGAMRQQTLGWGHLLDHYSNQENPNYTPAGARLAIAYSFLRTEVLASDVLGARLFAGEVAVDVARLAGAQNGWDRFHVAVSAAYDAGRAGGVASPLLVMHADLSGIFWKGETVRAAVVGGAGVRSASQPMGGALGGVSVDLSLGEFQGGLKVELRKTNGGYRPNLFGPVYEISRYVGGSMTGVGVADERLPDSGSLHAQVQAQWADALELWVSGETFFFGRTDVFASASLKVLNERVVTRLSFAGIGFGQSVVPRVHAQGQLYVRLAPGWYAYGGAGTAYFRSSATSLLAGYFGQLGIGSDLARAF